MLSLVGQGGTTKVYLAKDKKINRQWAVKILRNDLQNYVQSKNALLREAQMLKRLKHPAIPNIVDIIDSKEYFAIIMEYVEGVSLDAIVENYGKQSVENIIDWSIQICDVLGYLYSQSPPCIYRDMKPSNVILKPDGHISLIDFGIMRTYKPNNLADTVCLGTAGFAASEQFGIAQTDCRSDIYALGMTMYNLFVGMRPKKNISISFDNERDSLSRGLVSIIKKMHGVKS